MASESKAHDLRDKDQEKEKPQASDEVEEEEEEEEEQEEEDDDEEYSEDEDDEEDVDMDGEDEDLESEHESGSDHKTNGATDAAHAGQKRKDRPIDTTATENGSSTKNKVPKIDKATASPKQLLNFLLSSAALPFCFPEEELSDAAKSSSKKYKCYSLTSPTSFTPFEHLVCAHLLSKPLSHALGMRSVRTLLNDPFNLSSARAIVNAGEKRVWEALEAARTQHRQKTAAYLFGMGEAYDRDGGDAMYTLAEQANDGGHTGVVAHIKETVPGLGPVGAEIFCRRVQCVDGWGDALWPFADAKSLDALREIGIPVEDAEDLQSAIEREVEWDKVGDMGLQERDLSQIQLVGEQEETQMQAEFVVALERAIGCVLEGKVDQFKKAAAEA